MKKIFFVIAAMSMTAGSVFAADAKAAAGNTTTSTSKVEDLKKPTEKVKDIDEEITDARLRASLGSKSRWSFQSALSYSGGSVKDPLGTVRPAYRTSAEDEALAYLAGTVGVNFRMTDRDNLSFGTGIAINDPLHGDITKPAIDKRDGANDETVPRYEISTPYLGWSRGYRAFDIQMVSSATYSHYTDADSAKRAMLGGVSLSQTFLANFGSTKWNGGTSVSLGKTLYSGDVTNPGLKAKIAAGRYSRSDMSAGIFPFLQYTFNDRYSFRTVFGYFQFAKYENHDTYVQIEPYQSIGVGLSITRDIYLYPNVQFTPKDIRNDRTNVGLTANVNLF